MQISCGQCGFQTKNSAPATFCPRCGTSLKQSGSAEAAVELIDVCKAFRGKRVLRDVCLRAYPGESVVIVGMSGSGKSVLLDHMIGFQQPDSGQVLILGKTGKAPQAGQGRLGMVFQGAALLDSLTVRENTLLAHAAYQIPEPQEIAKADAYLAAVGIAPQDGDLYPAELSGGMQKRVGIARALMQEPQILLYDEPTTGLDAATSASISRLMRQVQQQHPRMTSITITHDYLSAGLIGDRVLYLNHQTGGLEEIMTREEIGEIRARCGGETRESIQEIRGQLEGFFDNVKPALHTGRSSAADAGWGSAFVSVTTGAFQALGAAALLVPKVGRPTRGLPRQLYEVGYRSLMITCLTGFFLGLMLTVQIAAALRTYGYDLLPGIVGLIMLDKLGPLFLGLLLAGRLGASVSADAGGKRLTRQFDALESVSISPHRYWLAPVFWAALCTFPVLAALLEFSGLCGAYAVAIFGGFANASYFLQHVFDRTTLITIVFGWLRAGLFGMAITLTAFAEGAEPKRDSEAVGRSTTQAVVGACLGVIALDFLATFVNSLLGN